MRTHAQTIQIAVRIGHFPTILTDMNLQPVDFKLNKDCIAM